MPVSEAQFREAYVHGERTLGKNPIIQPDFTFRQTLEKKRQLQLEFLHQEDYLSPLLDDLYSRTQAETRKSREVLLRLKEQYPMVLVSNFYGNIQTVLGEFGLDGVFSQIIESAVVGVRKPDPRIFSLGVEALWATASIRISSLPVRPVVIRCGSVAKAGPTILLMNQSLTVSSQI